MIAPQKEPHSFPLTDSGNAELIAELDGERLRFDHLQGIWLIWNGSYWVHDQDGEVYRIAKAAARARLRSAADLTSDLKRKEVVHWAIKSESQYRIEAALKLAKHTNPIADPGGNWDPDPLMFGVDIGLCLRLDCDHFSDRSWGAVNFPP